MEGNARFVSVQLHKKYSFHSGISAGARGPHVYTGETQRFIHRLINYQKPGDGIMTTLFFVIC